MSRKERKTGKKPRRRRTVIMLAAVLCMLAAVCSAYVGWFNITLKNRDSMQPTPQQPIITENADISKERLGKGLVKNAQLDGMMDFGTISVGVINQIQTERGKHYVSFQVFGHPDATHMKLAVGQTQSSDKIGISMTLIALTNFDGSQGVRVLVEPYQPEPVVYQKANIPQGRLTQGLVETVRLGTSFDPCTGMTNPQNSSIGFNEAQITVPYKINCDGGTYSLRLSLVPKGFADIPDTTVKLGETKTPKRFGYSITFVELTDVEGQQGATLLVTPMSE